ncbi:MAG: RHS repeat domain-containing protein [Planctomycetota bacterium]
MPRLIELPLRRREHSLKALVEHRLEGDEVANAHRVKRFEVDDVLGRVHEELRDTRLVAEVPERAVGLELVAVDARVVADNRLQAMARNEGGRDGSCRVEEAGGIEADKTTIVEMVYDARGRMITRKEKLASAPTWGDTVYFYGLRDQLTKVVDPVGSESRTEHNEQLWTTKAIAENGASDVITEHVYDGDGRQTTYRATNAGTGNQETLYSYDAVGQLIETEWPDEESHVYTYDLAGRRISTTDPNGTVTVASYDDNGRLIAKALDLAADIVGATAITFEYDGLDRMTLATTDEDGSFTSVVERTYNTLGKIEAETQVIDGYNSDAGRTITSAWDIEGERTSVTYPVSASVVSFTRDDLGRVDVISRGGVQVVDYTFSGGRVLKKAYPESYSLLTYDYFGRLTQTHHKDTDTGNTLARFDLAYDASHQITSQDKHFYDDVENTRILADTNDEGDQYAYDGAKRLVTVLRGVPTAYIGDSMASNISNNRFDDKVEYHFDQTGNRTTREIDDVVEMEYEYDRGNQLTVEGAFEPLHNANGANTGIDGWTGSYGYNAAEQLALYETGNLVTELIYTWHYDALGRQIARTKTGTGGAANVRMYYDGLHDVQVVEESSGTETLVKTRVYGERIDELLQYTDEAAEGDPAYYAHADHLGSVMLMADADGDIAESYRYKEYGETTVVDGSFVKQTDLGSDIGNFIRYTGRERAMPGSFGNDMYWYRARSYRPEVGRFMQSDPIGYVDGSNHYSYVSSNPVVLRDPTGTTGVHTTLIGRCAARIANTTPPQRTGPFKGCDTTFIYTDPSRGGGASMQKSDTLTPLTHPGGPNQQFYIYGGGCKVDFLTRFPWVSLEGMTPCRFDLTFQFHLDLATCPAFAMKTKPDQGHPTTTGFGLASGPALNSGTVSSPFHHAPPAGSGAGVSASVQFKVKQQLGCGQPPIVSTVTWSAFSGATLTSSFEVQCDPCTLALIQFGEW